MKKIIVIFLCTFLAGAISVKAQDIGQILSGSAPDANKYLQGYLEPFGKGEIMNMGRGWFNTARVHKTLGFDLSISAQLAIIPTAGETFHFANSDYSTFKLGSGASSTNLPTALGPKSGDSISVNTTVNGKAVTYSFKSPDGLKTNLKDSFHLPFLAVPLPVVQFGIGLIKHTELKVRFFPQTDFKGTSVGLFGLAVQHEFDYLPFLKKVPFLHMSALVGFNSVNATSDLKNSGIQGSNQKVAFKISTFTVQGIASIKLALLEIYTAIGYTTGTSNVNLNGTYTINYKDKNSGQTVSNTVTDPIALSYKNSGIANTWGARVNFFFLKVFADYTFSSPYNGASAGFALSFR